MTNLPDIQLGSPMRNIEIKQVGVSSLLFPFKLQSALPGNPVYDVLAEVSIRTDLNEQTKGISMSRLPICLKKHLGTKLMKHGVIFEILEDVAEIVGSRNSFISFKFKMPVLRKAPLSGEEALLYHNCYFEGQFVDGLNYFFQGVKVQYASYCPCSAALCKHLAENGSAGFPHAQRSFATVVVHTGIYCTVWLEELVAIVEKSIKTLPFPIVKRIDEQELARIAASAPIFVEDAIREISYNLNADKRFNDWWVKCVHEESIHQHEAFAINFKGRNFFSNSTNIII